MKELFSEILGWFWGASFLVFAASILGFVFNIFFMLTGKEYGLVLWILACIFSGIVLELLTVLDGNESFFLAFIKRVKEKAARARQRRSEEVFTGEAPREIARTPTSSTPVAPKEIARQPVQQGIPREVARAPSTSTVVVSSHEQVKTGEVVQGQLVDGDGNFITNQLKSELEKVKRIWQESVTKGEIVSDREGGFCSRNIKETQQVYSRMVRVHKQIEALWPAFFLILKKDASNSLLVIFILRRFCRKFLLEKTFHSHLLSHGFEVLWARFHQ